ncbi:MAG: PadR family transcriptional regulator [bacterium]|nr:PadR family transcriptional regulator [bacterium]
MRAITKQEEQILLTIHSLKEQAYLVTIRDKLMDITGRELDVGTVYKPLKRLNRDGFLDTYLGEPTSVRGGKAIKYYKLSKNGIEVLREVKKVQDKLWQDVVLTELKF